MLFHNTIRKYTLALLSTFNSLKIENKLSDGTYETKFVPIKYANREKATLFSETETSQLLDGNYNILPRSSIFLSTVTRQDTRITNKFNKINTTEFGEFVFNAMPYEFNYEMTIMCRGTNEASMLMEQIAVKFNPTYTLKINEVPNQTEPTSVVVQLVDIALETGEYEDISANIVLVNVALSLKGNFYPPIQESGLINNVKIFSNLWHTSDENEATRAALYCYDVDNSIVGSSTRFPLMSVEGESIDEGIAGLYIEGPDTMFVDEAVTFEAVYSYCGDGELTFNWSNNIARTATTVEDGRFYEISSSTTASLVLTLEIYLDGELIDTIEKNVSIIAVV